MNEGYRTYLMSAHWFRTRQRMLELAGNVCEFCGDEDRNHVHHLSYANLWKEPDEDLAVLCWSCHKDVHELPKQRAEIEHLIRVRREQAGGRPAPADEPEPLPVFECYGCGRQTLSETCDCPDPLLRQCGTTRYKVAA